MDELRNKLKSTNFNRIINNYDCNTPLESNRIINELWSFEEWLDNADNIEAEDAEWIFMNAYKLGVSMYASAQEEDQEAMKTFAKLVESVQMSRDKIKVPVYFIYKFLEDILNGDVSKRLLKDMQTSHSKTILKTEFNQYKSILKVDNKGAFRLFERIRECDRSVTWDQIRDYFDSCRDLFQRVEDAIRIHKRSGDHDPNMEELRHVLTRSIMGDSSGMDKLGIMEVNWLFNMVSNQHGSKVTLIQLSDFMASWADIASDIQELFRDQVRLRKKEETQTKRLQRITDVVEETGENFENFMQEIRDAGRTRKDLDIVDIMQTGHPSNAPSTAGALSIPGKNAAN